MGHHERHSVVPHQETQFLPPDPAVTLFASHEEGVVLGKGVREADELAREEGPDSADAAGPESTDLGVDCTLI